MAPIRAWSRTSSRRRCSNLAKDEGLTVAKPTSREGWGELARDLGVKVIHIAERDTQVPGSPRRSASSSTPGRSTASSARAASPPSWAGARTRRACRPTVRGTSSAATPRSTSTGRALLDPRAYLDAARGPVPRLHHHPQRIDLDRRLLHAARRRRGRLPADGALRLPSVRRRDLSPARDRREELAPAEEAAPDRWRRSPRAATSSACSDGHKKGAYWYGCQLDIHETRRAHALQQRHLDPGLRRRCCRASSGRWRIPTAASSRPTRWTSSATCEICTPYLGPVVGGYGDWTPLKDRDGLFPEDLDETDPWQFKNFRVV